MIGKGPRPAKAAAPPPVQYAGRVNKRPSKPEPRILRKHAMNEPIVTIFGAGVAGLTAAHELVERGFVVQVIEAKEDVFCPGRPAVGGMAANQPARVRASIEELHQPVLQYARESDARSRVARWLLKMFALNRSRWLSTEVPERIQSSLFTETDSAEHEDFRSSLVASLKLARARYRQQWLWDLIVRSAHLGLVSYPKKRNPDDPREAEETPAEAAARHEAAVQNALELYNELSADTVRTAELARVLHAYPTQPTDQRSRDIPSEGELLEHMDKLVVPALEREFLCFRLIAHSLHAFDQAPGEARRLHKAWEKFLAREFPHNYVKQRSDDQIPVEEAKIPPDLPPDPRSWLQIEVIEQRLPGEHGYRFFPSFYRHLDDTMKRIPLFIGNVPSGRSVYDNLRPTVFQGIGLSAQDRDAIERLGGTVRDEPSSRRGAEVPTQRGPAVVELHRDRPRSLEGFRNRTDRFVQRIGGTKRDAVVLLAKFLRFMTSSPERRREFYEKENWRDFLIGEEGKRGERVFSPAMLKHIESASQALLAFSASEADARTYGNVALQMLLDQLDDGTRVDRTLNGPTSDAWLEPWREYLERHGVRFFRRTLTGLRLSENDELIPEFEPERAVSARQTKSPLQSQDGYALLTHDQDPDHDGLAPDFYVLALSLEQTLDLIRPLQPNAKQARDFWSLLEFGNDVTAKSALKTMTGAQFFFNAKTSIGRGHMYFPFSEWGLSSISQSEFWSARGGFSDGYFGVLSVDVCSTGDEDGSQANSFWRVLKGLDGKGFVQADEKGSQFKLAQDIWAQIAPRISDRDQIAEPRCFHIDQTVTRDGNESKYLASTADLDTNRPGRKCDVGSNGQVIREPKWVGKEEIDYALNYKRWVLSGAFMATRTRMTTMEAANESARHAVSTILKTLHKDDAQNPEPGRHKGEDIQIENLHNKTYNGASKQRIYDLPDTWNLEDEELEDLEIFKRVDRRLNELGLPHFMDIIDFDKKLKHALDGIELYGEEKSLAEVLGSGIAGVDAVLTKELGRGYEKDLGTRVTDGRNSVAAMRDALPSPIFDDMKGLLGRLQTLMGTLAGK